MKTTHKTTIHATCPHGCWDYYDVEFEPAVFITVEYFQAACDKVRGMKEYQEIITERLASELPSGLLTVRGRHGANTETVCTHRIP